MKELLEIQKKLEENYEKLREHALGGPNGKQVKDRLAGYWNCLNDLNILISSLPKKKKE